MQLDVSLDDQLTLADELYGIVPGLQEMLTVASFLRNVAVKFLSESKQMMQPGPVQAPDQPPQVELGLSE